MTQKEKNDYRNAATIAIYCAGYYGLELKAIRYGIDDSIVYVDSITGNVYARRVYYTNPRNPEAEAQPYFIDDRYGRVYLRDCLRT